VERSHMVLSKSEIPQSNNYRFSIVMESFSVISLVYFFINAAIFTFLSNRSMALDCGVCALLWVGIFLINRKGFHSVPFFCGILISIFFSYLATYFFGWNSGYFFSTVLVIPIVFLNSNLKQPIKKIIAFLIGCLLLFLFFFSWSHQSLWVAEKNILHWLYAMNLVFTITILSVTSHFFEMAASDAERALIVANKKLTGLATTDPVTNLVNRRTMMTRIEQEKERMERGGKPFTLIMIDVDNFKQVNDEYGHDGGDFVLVNLAEMINLSLRKQDVIARWGGDEFLMLLPETELEGGRVVAEKIRSRIIRSPFVYREMDIPVTVTFGVGLCDSNVGIGSCIRKADQALYQGKQAGKNRVGVMK
jgi:diguanylate cyclase